MQTSALMPGACFSTGACVGGVDLSDHLQKGAGHVCHDLHKRANLGQTARMTPITSHLDIQFRTVQLQTRFQMFRSEFGPNRDSELLLSPHPA